jgi:ABC-2 type transport system permease protein
MKITLPPALEDPPPPQSFLSDFMLLTKNQMRVTWNKWRYSPAKTWILTFFLLAGLLIFIAYLGSVAYGAIGSVSFELGQSLLSLLFMSGLIAQIFFGITAAFTSLYMSEDLELLFMAPVSVEAVFAVKSLSVFVSNLVTAVLFVLLPGIFYGLLFQAGGLFYLMVVLVTLGLLTIGTALAELLNLLVMRIVPPHRSKEAVGFIGALAGIIIALMFQIPNMMMGRGEQLDIGSWLAGNAEILKVMNFFPWGWGSKALVAALSGNALKGLGWSLLLFLLGVLLFILAFSFVERGFRRGFISLSQGEGGHRSKKRKVKELAEVKTSQIFATKPGEDKIDVKASAWTGVWAVAKKDLLYLKRDTREWFGYLTPLIIMAFFIAQYLFGGSEGSRASLITVFIMYTIMFSGNMALQSFGREGESDWLLNSVPLTGWPVVFGKLLASVLPTLVLMQALLVGTGIAIGLSFSALVAFAIGGVLLSLGSSAIGLFYSINNSRFNPESPQQRISPGASMIMYLINLVFILFLAVGIIYIFRPAELTDVLRQLPPVTYEGGFWSVITYGLYLLSRPLLWPSWAGILTGIFVTGVVWSGMFFGFLAATVRQCRKGFRVEIVTNKKKK